MFITTTQIKVPLSREGATDNVVVGCVYPDRIANVLSILNLYPFFLTADHA
jgi:hypothetical protein